LHWRYCAINRDLLQHRLLAALFFGGWQFLPGFGAILAALPLEGFDREVARVLLEFASFWIKVGFFLWLFVWVRWTLPRFRFDQLMAIGWKVMLPLSLLNLLVTGFLVYLGVM
jgi:NADH-quinone oxidoreductase subunit H